MHGACTEGWFTGSVLAAISGEKGSADWTYMEFLSREAASQGIAVLMIGLHDDDVGDMNSADVGGPAGIDFNGHPQVDYSKYLRAAVDYLSAATSKVFGAQVDTARIGLMGHSLGGGGVLYAAAHDCRDVISTVLSLNPCHLSQEAPNDNWKFGVKYLSGKDHSGEFGEGTLTHLSLIKVPALIYGSQAEYNTPLSPGAAVAPMWPVFPSVFEQLGSADKELYVDDVTENSAMVAHTWMGRDMDAYAGGDRAGTIEGDQGRQGEGGNVWRPLRRL